MKYVIIGAGSRGMTYGSWAAKNGIEIAAVAELRSDRLQAAGEAFGVPEAMRFTDAGDLFAKGKIADAAIIATLDRDHFGHVMQALDVGYDILLEKPISPDAAECLQIEEKANALGRKIAVCHVLRYTNFWGTIKNVLDSGELGKIVSIKHSENIGNYHMAHSFVRGNWRNDALSSPIILQKTCHDLLVISSDVPMGQGARTVDCPVRAAEPELVSSLKEQSKLCGEGSWRRIIHSVLSREYYTRLCGVGYDKAEIGILRELQIFPEVVVGLYAP